MERFAYKIGAQGARDRARQFMGNEIARGIVELITNSDAAYTAQGVSQPKQRPIAVVVNAAARYIEVRYNTCSEIELGACPLKLSKTSSLREVLRAKRGKEDTSAWAQRTALHLDR